MIGFLAALILAQGDPALLHGDRVAPVTYFSPVPIEAVVTRPDADRLLDLSAAEKAALAAAVQARAAFVQHLYRLAAPTTGIDPRAVTAAEAVKEKPLLNRDRFRARLLDCLDAPSRARLEQLHWQMLGPFAVVVEPFATAIGATAEQRRRLAAVGTSLTSEMYRDLDAHFAPLPKPVTEANLIVGIYATVRRRIAEEAAALVAAPLLDKIRERQGPPADLASLVGYWVYDAGGSFGDLKRVNMPNRNFLSISRPLCSQLVRRHVGLDAQREATFSSWAKADGRRNRLLDQLRHQLTIMELRAALRAAGPEYEEWRGFDQRVKNLLTAEQYHRLRSCRFQALGPNELLNTLYKELPLSVDQRQRVSSRRLSDEFFAARRTNPGDLPRLLREYRAKQVAPLSPEQRRKWEEFCGPPIPAPVLAATERFIRDTQLDYEE